MINLNKLALVSKNKIFIINSINWQKLADEYEKTKTYRVAEKLNYYTSAQGIPKIPLNLSLRDYQKEAVVNWFRNKGRGTLKMATGSGKTITALAIAVELFSKIKLQVLLVICPYRHLVTQWEKECCKFNLKPLLAFETVHNWQSELSNQLYNIYTKNQQFLTVITTNSTLINDSFQSLLQFFPEKTLIIGDEAHNLGAQKTEKSLPRNIGLRLALSATPERYFDEEGTDALLRYFGSVIKPEFTLADALKKGALIHYNYYPIFVELTQEEALRYAKLTKRIGWVLNNNYQNFQQNKIVTSLLMKRTRLVGAATNKLNALYSLMSKRLETTHTLFYCGDSTVNYNSSLYRRQLETVTHILGVELGYRINTYTAQTSLSEREKMKQQLETGELQGIVAIRCLDEGVDLPSIRNAVILASSGNPRQFIQRRGRILRPYPGKKQANLFDMIVIPPNLEREIWELERNLLRKEIRRLVEFANLADNAIEARNELLNLQEKYGLLEIT
jgi:DNA phosphorothioation system restriction enzyme